MPKPVCIICERFMTKEESGLNMVEMYREGEVLQWKPYKVWSVDLYRCARCGFKILSDYGLKPLLESWQDDFDEEYAKIENEKKYFVY